MIIKKPKNHGNKFDVEEGSKGKEQRVTFGVGVGRDGGGYNSK